MFPKVFNESTQQGDRLYVVILVLKYFLLKFHYFRFDSSLDEHQIFHQYQIRQFHYLIIVNAQFLDCKQVF